MSKNIEFNNNVLVIPSVKGIVKILNKMNLNFSFIEGEMSQLIINIYDNKVKISHKSSDIRSFSHVWLSSYWDTRDLAHAISIYLQYHKVPHTPIEQSTSKITDQLIFALNGIKTPNTVFADRQKVLNNPRIVEKICKYPLIIKDIKGARGKLSRYINNRQELLYTLKKLPKYRTYLYQSYVANRYDWGILIANGNVVSAEKSYHSQNEFRTNVCNGGHEVFIELSQVPQAVKNMAIKASKLLNLTWSRADILINQHTREPYLLELNRCPGITEGTSEAFGVHKFMQEYLRSSFLK